MSSQPSHCFETFEVRRLLAAAVDAAWDLLGTEDGDVINVTFRPSDARLLASMNGQVVGTRLLRNASVIQISGLGGNDRITVDLHGARRVPGVWVNGGSGRDVITGSSGNDRLLGGSGRDIVDGAAGDDAILGGTDRDELTGGDGNDYLQGNAGNDTLSGGWGDDTCTGGTGADQLRGGSDADNLVGGKDADTLKGGDDGDTLSGGASANTLFRQLNIDDVLSGDQDSVKDDDSLPPLHRLASKADLKNWVIDRAIDQWKDRLGQPVVPIYQWLNGGVLFASSDVQLDSMVTASGALASADHSTTNNQVAGVNESDIVQTDSNYIYLLRDGKVIIADASPGSDLHIVKTIAPSDDADDAGYASGLYLDGSRLTVVSQTSNYRILQGGGRLLTIDGAIIPDTGKPQVVVTVYDVSDAAHPAAVETTTMDGWLQDSRMIDGRLYAVVQNYLNAPAPETVKNDKDEDVYVSEAEYRAQLESGGIDDLIPHYAGSGDVSGELIAAPDVYVRDDATNLDVSTVALLNTRDGASGVIDATSAVGTQGQIYASADSLYLAGYGWSSVRPFMQVISTDTQIVKFGLGVDEVTLEASGSVKGNVLNKYSMDQAGQFFRIAATEEGIPADQSTSVYVMDQIGDDLTTIGQIDNIAPGERLYSARFMGDRAYLTTFQQVDPLFSLDLSEPTAPRITGQLEIPGFSEYLHPVYDGFLIGLGRVEDSQGGFHQGQLSLFDVRDEAHPIRVGTFDFGDDTWSLASWDPHAFSYFPDQHILAVPNEQKLLVLKVDPAKGFTKLGEVSHTSGVQRSVRIGDELFSIGSEAIRVTALDDPSDVLATLDLPQGGGVIEG